MPGRTYFTYIMASRSHTLYIGMTRATCTIASSSTNGASMTASPPATTATASPGFNPSAKSRTPSTAKKNSKAPRRKKKIALIEHSNPTWQDLSRDSYDLEPADRRGALDRINL